ncbi:MAG: hypothetical protein IPM13_19625 [Phycisphaerales bacterium]|nr:hypothetical protein [Phycisphaerales bacterium]
MAEIIATVFADGPAALAAARRAAIAGADWIELRFDRGRGARPAGADRQHRACR